MSQELLFAEVGSHSTKKDLYLVIHDKVYNASSFVDEHPGGEEVLLDVGGQDATEAFEDVGHSDEAREKLADLLIGTVKRQLGDPKPNNTMPQPPITPVQSGGMGVGLYIFILLGGALAFGAYKYMQSQENKV